MDYSFLKDWVPSKVNVKYSKKMKDKIMDSIAYFLSGFFGAIWMVGGGVVTCGIIPSITLLALIIVWSVIRIADKEFRNP